MNPLKPEPLKTNKIFLHTLIGFLLLTGVSCSILRKSGGEDHAAKFRSGGNGVAVIALDLKDNHRFHYEMVIFADPATSEQNHDTLSFKGRWWVEDNDYILRFRGRKKPDLHTLFSQQYSPATTIRIVDDRHIRFPVFVEEVSIWGVRCIKSKNTE